MGHVLTSVRLEIRQMHRNYLAATRGRAPLVPLAPAKPHFPPSSGYSCFRWEGALVLVGTLLLFSLGGRSRFRWHPAPSCPPFTRIG